MPLRVCKRRRLGIESRAMNDNESTRPLIPSSLLLGILAFFLVWLSFNATSGLSLFGDEAQYWYWAQNPAFGYYSKPPMVAWAIAATTSLCGNGEFCIRLGSPIAWALTGLGTFLLGRRLFCSPAFGASETSEPHTPLLATLLLLSVPAVTLSTTLITTDPFLVLFWVWGIYAFSFAVVTGRWLHWLLTGLIGGLGMLSKFNFAFFLVSALLFCALSRPHRHHLTSPRAWAAAALAFLIFLPNILWNARHQFVSFVHVAEDNAKLGGPLLNPVAMLEFLASQLAVFGPLLFLAFLGMIALRIRAAARIRTAPAEPELLLWCFIAPLFGFMVVLSLISKADPHWVSPVYPLASLMLVHGLKGKARHLLSASLALHLLVIALFHHYEPALRLAGIELSRKNDPFARLKGWREVGLAVSEAWSRHPGTLLLTDDRKVTAELYYYVRPNPFGQLVKWNFDTAISDHFELTTRVADHPGKVFLYVTDREPNQAVLNAFETVIPVTETVAYDGPSARRTVRVFRLEGFKG